jgi:hypothetical protein
MGGAVLGFLALSVAGLAGAMAGLWVFSRFGDRLARACRPATRHQREHNSGRRSAHPSALRTLNILRDLVRSGDAERALDALARELPFLAREAARNHPERPLADFVQDLTYATLQALKVNFKAVAELRTEQAESKYDLVWVAAYPFLDLVDKTDGGFYDTTLAKLNAGTTFVFFQSDRKYFDALCQKLKNDPQVAAAVDLTESSPHCQVQYVECRDHVILALNLALWNPGRPNMVGFINQGDPIALRQVEDDRWLLDCEPIVMAPLGDHGRLASLHAELDRAFQTRGDELAKKRNLIQMPERSK